MRDFNDPLSPINRSSRQKLSTEIRELTDIINQIVDIYKTFHPNKRIKLLIRAIKYSEKKINHILEYKASHYIVKKTDITPCVLSDHYRVNLDITAKRSRRMPSTHGNEQLTTE